MTSRQLHRRVALWQRRLAALGVGHWRFTVEVVPRIDPRASDPSDSDITGRADVSDLYDNVEFTFQAKALAEKGKQELDELIVHEWLHVADRDRDTAEEALMETLGDEAAVAWEDRLSRLREAQMERFSRLIVALHV